jgi:hypothetical protein
MPPYRLSLLVLALLPLTTMPGAATEPGCDYTIAVEGDTASALAIAVTCADPDWLGRLAFADASAAPFVTRQPDRDHVARFTIDLDGFAASSSDYDLALRIGRSLIVSPSTIVPVPLAGDVPLRLSLSTPSGAMAALGLPRDAAGRYLLRSGGIGGAGEWVLGRFDHFAVPGEAGLEVAILDAPRMLPISDLKRWVGDVAASNTRFWGTVPVTPKLLAVIPEAGRSGLPFGRLMADDGATILLLLGAETNADQLYDEWVLVHEFLHLGSPLMRDTGIWFNEGIATYFEPILRARAGWKNEDAVWREWLTSMPRGLPALTQTGLARAGSRGSYWGGALFLLLADVELRRRSGGRVGVEDCLRSVLGLGVDVRQRWPTVRMLAACQAATGSDVLADLAQKYVYAHQPLDLARLWRDLGVSLEADGSVRYDDNAGLASTRRVIVWGARREWAPVGAYRAPMR